MNIKSNQKNAIAGGDLVGGDKVVNNEITNNFLPPVTSALVDRLLAKLRTEVEQGAHTQEIIDQLQFFYKRSTSGGPAGLEEKLRAAGREYEIGHALEKKESFAKELERWSLYASAQSVFAHLLARAEHEFSMSVLPNLNDADHATINQMITARIVEPTVQECGDDMLRVDHRVAMGMVYWLAEQCFIRWSR